MATLDPPSLERAAARQEALRPFARDLYLAYHHDASHFNAQLFRLMHKADSVNFALLERGFPMACETYRLWRSAMDERTFFTHFRVGEILHGREALVYRERFGTKDDHEKDPEAQ